MMHTIVLGLLAASLQPELSAQPADGAWNHAVCMATSMDGRTWNERDVPVRVRSTSPTVVSLSGKGDAGEEGLLALYTLDLGGSHGMSLGRWVSNDAGKRWYATTGLSIDGDWGGSPRDICVVQLDDGRIRMYGVITPPPPPPVRDPGDPGTPQLPLPPGPPGRPRPIPPPSVPEGPPREAPLTAVVRSAISTDGLKFVIEAGDRFELANITTVDVAPVNGKWVMLLTRGREIVGARGDDGLAFTLEPAMSWEAAMEPTLCTIPAGELRVFAATQRGIVSATLDTQSWKIKPDASTLVSSPAGHPTTTFLAGGTQLLLFTRFLDGRDPRW